MPSYILHLDSVSLTYNHLHTVDIYTMFVNTEPVEAGKAALLTKHFHTTVNTPPSNSISTAAILDFILETMSPKLSLFLCQLQVTGTKGFNSMKPTSLT